MQEPGNSYPEKENPDEKRLKSSASPAVVIKSETPILASLDHLHGIQMELRARERSASVSPAFQFLSMLVQLKILNVDKTASKWL